MPIQDAFGASITRPVVGYAGMIAEGQAVVDVVSKRITNAAVGFGLAVGRDTADGTARLGGTAFEGITVADKASDNGLGTDTYAIGAMAGVLRKGEIWVTASTAVAPADPVTFTAATGVIGAGLVTTITGAKFMNTAVINGLVRVYLP